MKTCTKCGCEKPHTDFYKQAECKDGRRPDCKECVKARSIKWTASNKAKKSATDRAYREANPDKIRKSKREWNAANPEKMFAWTSAWSKQNREKRLEQGRQWGARNKHKVAEKRIRRRYSQQQATPAWADKDDIRMWYEVAEVLSRGGVKFHVDHQVPLRSKKVCGLHTPDNMTVLPWHENLAKGNHRWPDMP